MIKDNNDEVLKLIKDKNGIQEYRMDVKALYPDGNERRNFYCNFEKFLDANKPYDNIFSQKCDLIFYKSEGIVPPKSDDQPSLLIIVGNPASHSIEQKMPFACKTNGKEHPFWEGLTKSKIIMFSKEFDPKNIKETNEFRKKELFNPSKDSQLRTGLAVFYTMPSAAQPGEWNQVKGLINLFRVKHRDSGRYKYDAFNLITQIEKKRIERLIDQFTTTKGSVMVTQKNAYDAIKSLRSPKYNQNSESFYGNRYECECNPTIPLYCVQKTYLFNSEPVIETLSKIQRALTGK